MTNSKCLALCFELPKGAVPEWLELIPAGEMTGIDGRQFVNNNPEQILAYCQALNRDIPLDIAHATEIKGPKGEPAPAQGWFDKLEIREGAIWGKLAANSSGQSAIENREYRYISPAFYHDKNGHIFGLSSVALTNKPNLDLTALNQELDTETSSMKLPAPILAELSLNSETATEQDVLTAIQQLKTDKQLALNQAANPDLDKFVPKETYTLALNRAESAEGKLKQHQDDEINALVDAAISDGKVAPANKEMYVALCHTQDGIKQFNAFVEGAPKIVTDESTHKKLPDGDKTKLTEGELAMCHQLGLTEEEFLAAK